MTMQQQGDSVKRLRTSTAAQQGDLETPESTAGGSALLCSCLLLMLAGLFLTGCASVPKDYPRTESAAFPDHQSTAIGRYLAKAAARHPGDSGFAITRHGRQAFTGRAAATELAEKTLDLQYYIWEPDATGRLLAERLLRAADRGVRVRVLLDDITFKGRDAVIASLDAHPNIEIRMFNPFAHRGARGLDFLTDFNRVNHRMHNKIMIMDNAMAIVGGRNVGNHYFQVDTHANFRDLDIAAGGPVVREISSVFDHFWNGNWAVPIDVLVDRPYTEADLQAARATLRGKIAEDHYPYPIDQDVAELKSLLRAEIDKFVWAPGRIVWDDPAEIVATGSTSRMLEALHRRVGTLEAELLIESPYFVPRDRGIEKMTELNKRGVRVRVLTNSLAANDVLAAHAGYSGRRKQVLESGVELYELRADAGAIKKRVAFFGAKAALHAKVVVFDRKDVFIGSFNLDPRSADINTEAGLYVESPELTAQVVAWMDEGVLPENSYRVLLDEDGDLQWVTEYDGEEVRFDTDPESTGWQRFATGFIRILPVEDQL
jgi:putative cardiolipin synthase